MDFVTIENATRNLGKPRDWNDAVHGECGTLPIRDGVYNGVPSMTSAWKPNADELDALSRGAVIHLLVIGEVHPPVAMYVTLPPKGEADAT